MLTLSTVKFVGATTKAQDLPSQSQPHHGDQNRGKPLEELPTFTKLQLFVCSFVVFNVTPMQWHWGRGKTFLFTKAKRITSPEQWLVTLSPDWSQMTFLPKITPDDTPGGFSMQLVIEYSLYSKSWLYGYGRTLHCQSLSLSRHCEERVRHSVQLLSTAFNIIWSKYKENPTWLSYVDQRTACQLPLSPLISVLDKSILLEKECYAS